MAKNKQTKEVETTEQATPLEQAIVAAEKPEVAKEQPSAPATEKVEQKNMASELQNHPKFAKFKN